MGEAVKDGLFENLLRCVAVGINNDIDTLAGSIKFVAVEVVVGSGSRRSVCHHIVDTTDEIVLLDIPELRPIFILHIFILHAGGNIKSGSFVNILGK